MLLHTQAMSLQPLRLPSLASHSPESSFSSKGQDSWNRQGQRIGRTNRAKFRAPYMIPGKAFLGHAGKVMKASRRSSQKILELLLLFFPPKQASSMLLMHFRWSNFP